MPNVRTILKAILPLCMLVLLSFYVNNVFTSYEIKIKGLNEQITELNYYIDDLTEYITNTPDTIIVRTPTPKARTIVKVDTVFIPTAVDYYDIDSTITAPFTVVDKQAGAYIQLEGYSRFKWSIAERKYKLIETELTNKLVNLNLTADYAVAGSNLTLAIFNSSTQVNITNIQNNTLDMSKVHVAQRSRWGLGIVGGIGLINTGATPFIGVGVTYQFKDISFIK